MGVVVGPLAFTPRRRRLLSEAVAYWKASRYSGSGDLLDLSGNGHHARLGSAAGADANDPLFLARPSATRYVYFPGTASNNLSVPRPVISVDYLITYEDATTLQRTVAVSDPLVFGNTDADFADKKVRSILLTNTAGGAQVGIFNAALTSEPYASHVDANGNTWTFNRSATGGKLVVVDRALFLLRVDDFFEIPDHADLDFAAGDSFTVAMAMRMFGDQTNRVPLAKIPRVGGPGYQMYWVSATELRFSVSGAGSAESKSPAMAAGVLSVLSGVRNTVADSLTTYLDGAAGVSVTDATTATSANALALRFGGYPDGVSAGDMPEMEFFGTAIFRKALTNSEIRRLARELKAA